MSPLDAKLILDEIAKLNRRFDESYARMERCFSRALASLEPRGDGVELCIGSTEQIGETQPIVADNWGGLFDEITAPDATFTTVLKDIKPEESLLVEYPHQIEKGEEKLQVAPLEEALSKREVGKRALARPPRLLASIFTQATDAALDSELSGTTGKGASLDALDRDSLAEPAREFVVGDVSAPHPPRLRPPWRAPPRRPWRSPRPTQLRRPQRAPPRPPWLRGPRRAPPRPPWRARRRRRAAGMEARHPFQPGLRLRRPQGPPRRPHYRGVPAPTLLPPPPRDAATASPIPTPREASSQVLAAAWRKLGAHSVHAARVFDEMLLCHQPLSASVPTVFTFQCAALPSAAVFHARTAVRGAALSSVGRQGLAIIHDTSALQAEELLSCGGDFTNSCDFNLIGAPVVFVRSCDENMVNLRLLSSSDWVEQQPWPPPPMQVASVCSSAAIRPTPWPPPECIEAMNQDIFATSQESVHCSAYVQNFCQELIYLGIYTRGQVTVIPVLSRGQGFQFRMLNENEFRDAVLLVFANKQDLPIAMNATEIPRKLGLHSIRQRHWYIQNTCATAVNFYSLAVEDDPPATTLCANRSLCWLQQRKGNRVLSNAPLCIVMCPHWSKACHRQGAALNFLKDCKEVVHAFEQALKHARAKSQRTLHMHAPKCLTTDLIALVPWKFWPWLGSYTSDMFRKLRVLWSPRVWGCSSALMLTSSVLLGALLVAQLVSLVFCWELMLQYNADCFSSTYSEPEFLQFPWDPGGSMLLHRLGGRPSLITATRDVMLIVNWQLLALVLPACFAQLQRGGLTEFDSNSYSHEFSISLWELLAVMKSISYMEILLSIFRCLIDMLVWDGPVLLGGNLDWCRFPGCFLLLSSIWPVTKKHQLIGSSDGDCTYDLLLKQPWPPPVLLRLSHAGVVLLLLQWPSFCRYRTDKKSKLLLFRGSTHAAWGQAAFKGEGNVSNMGQYYTMSWTRTSLEAHDANTNKEYKERKARGVEASNNYQNYQVANNLLMDSMDWFVLLPPLLEGMVRSVSNDPMLLEAYLGHEYYQGRVELNRVDSIETSVTLIESHPAISMLDAHAEEESVALSVPQDEGISNTSRAQAPLIEENSINRS